MLLLLVLLLERGVRCSRRRGHSVNQSFRAGRALSSWRACKGSLAWRRRRRRRRVGSPVAQWRIAMRDAAHSDRNERARTHTIERAHVLAGAQLASFATRTQLPLHERAGERTRLTMAVSAQTQLGDCGHCESPLRVACKFLRASMAFSLPPPSPTLLLAGWLTD